MDDLISQTNQHFGGLTPKIYRILLTHGEMDPLRTLSALSDLNPQAKVHVINSKIKFTIKYLIFIIKSFSVESFSRDMGSPSEVQDYPHLLEVKGIIREEILGFISAADEDQPTTPPPNETPPPIEPGSY